MSNLSDDDNGRNQAILSAIVPVFRSVYFQAKLEEPVKLMVANKGYEGCATTAAFFYDAGVPTILMPESFCTQFSGEGCKVSLTHNLLRSTLWHELGHYTLAHRRKFLIYAFRILALSPLFIFGLDKLFSHRPEGLICVPFISALSTALLLSRKLRKNEYEADIWGAKDDSRRLEVFARDRLIKYYYGACEDRCELQNSSSFAPSAAQAYKYCASWFSDHSSAEDRFMAVIKHGLATCKTDAIVAYRSRVIGIMDEVTTNFCEFIRSSVAEQTNNLKLVAGEHIRLRKRVDTMMPSVRC